MVVDLASLFDPTQRDIFKSRQQFLTARTSGGSTGITIIQPGQLLSLLGRAQAFEIAGRPLEATQDYSAALSIQPDQWEALANRACLHFDLGNFDQALDDINHAIRLAPRIGDLYQSRAVVLETIGRHAESRLDLAKYEEMAAHAPA